MRTENYKWWEEMACPNEHFNFAENSLSGLCHVRQARGPSTAWIDSLLANRSTSLRMTGLRSCLKTIRCASTSKDFRQPPDHRCFALLRTCAATPAPGLPKIRGGEFARRVFLRLRGRVRRRAASGHFCRSPDAERARRCGKVRRRDRGARHRASLTHFWMNSAKGDRARSQSLGGSRFSPTRNWKENRCRRVRRRGYEYFSRVQWHSAVWFAFGGPLEESHCPQQISGIRFPIPAPHASRFPRYLQSIAAWCK